MKKHAVYEKVLHELVLEGDGEEPHQDRLGGHEQRPSRWVAKEKITGPRPDLFSATSLLEGVKLVIWEVASSNQKGTVLLVTDVRRAYFHAKARRRVHIELPEGDGGGPGSRQCGLLKKSLYGPVTLLKTGIASLGRLLGGDGSAQGTSEHVVVLRRGAWKASREDPEWLIRKFKERYHIKTQMIGEAQNGAMEFSRAFG